MYTIWVETYIVNLCVPYVFIQTSPYNKHRPLINALFGMYLNLINAVLLIDAAAFITS